MLCLMARPQIHLPNVKTCLDVVNTYQVAGQNPATLSSGLHQIGWLFTEFFSVVYVNMLINYLIVIILLNESNDEKMRKYFEDKLRSSGHAFESKVEGILQKDFDVSREVPFFDKDEKKNRAIDFKAKTHYPGSFELKPAKDPALGVINLIVECKSVENYGWLFYKDSLANNTMQNFDYVNWMSHTKKTPGIDFPKLPITPIQDIVYASKHVEYFKEGNGKKKDIKPFIASVYSISKAVNYFLERESKVYNDLFLKHKFKSYPLNQTFTVFQPLIVFGGQLYEVLGEDENIKLNSIQMAQIKKTYYSDNYKINSGVIHITTLEGLPNYLEKVKKYFNIDEKFLKFQEESSKLWFS